jgi:hypothetical protein
MSTICFALGALILLPVATSAATWDVYVDGSGDGATIQAAIDLASPGDEILVHPGTYLERPVAHKGLSLIAVGGPDVTTIQGPGFEDVLVIYIEESDPFVLRGFRIVGSGSDENFGWPYRAVNQSSASLTLEDCDLESFSVYNATVRNCRMVGFESNDNRATDSLIEDCLFRDLRDSWGASAVTVWGSTTVRGCTFDHCDGFTVAPVVGYADGATATIEDNLVVDCIGPCVGPWFWPPVTPRAASVSGAIGSVIVRGNTFARNENGPFGPWSGEPTNPFAPLTFDANVVTGCEFGVWFPAGVAYTLSCNDSWGNDSNWTGIPDPTGTDGNISSAPLFCDAPGNDFTVAPNSPLLPLNNECGVRIGAFGVGVCGAVSVEPSSWAEIKGRFRR